MILFTLIAGSSGWCTIEQEEIKQEGVWRDYRKPFEEDILVSQVATIMVNLPERFFKAEKITLSVTTDATPESDPKIAIGKWEKKLGALLTPAEYFTTLALTETINLEIPTGHFRKGENEIKFYSLTDRPEDQYIVTKLEFAVSQEEVAAIPRPEAVEKVRIGLVINIAKGSISADEKKYVHLLMDEIRKQPNREVVTVAESISYHNLDVDMARILGQRYRIDMLIGANSIYRYGEGFQGVTKLIDISGQRLIELEPVDIGAGYAAFRPGWEKKLVSQQIGPIEKMADEISQEKVAVAAVPAELRPLEKVRIGVLTSFPGTLLDPSAESFKRYMDYLTDELGKRPNLEVITLEEQISYHNIDIDAARSLKQKHQIDMVIGVMNYLSSGRGYEGHTKLVDLSAQKLIELEPVTLGGLGGLDVRWERKLVSKQLGPIREMIDEISQQKLAVAPAPTERRPFEKVRVGVVTELQKNLEAEYFTHLKEALGKREDIQLVRLVGQVTYDAPHPEAIEGLKRKHQIDMIIYVGTKAYSTGELYWTGLVDTSNQKFVEGPKVYIKQENRYRWEKMLVERQIKPIENMIDEISQKKLTAIAPERDVAEKVRIGLLTGSGISFLTDEKKYIHHLIDEIGKKLNCEVLRLKEPISYHDLDIDMAQTLRQKYEIDMIIGVRHRWQSGLGANSYTKLIDTSAQRLIELEPVELGGLGGLKIGWEKKLVSNQIGPIKEMVDEISHAKQPSTEPEKELTVSQLKPVETKKVRIGVVTELSPDLEKEYFMYLEEALGKRENYQLINLPDPIDYDAINSNAIERLKRQYEVDIVVSVGFRTLTTGEKFYTKLFDTSAQNVVELRELFVPYKDRHRWGKMLVARQTRPIEKMVDEISRP